MRDWFTGLQRVGKRVVSIVASVVNITTIASLMKSKNSLDRASVLINRLGLVPSTVLRRIFNKGSIGIQQRFNNHKKYEKGSKIKGLQRF